MQKSLSWKWILFWVSVYSVAMAFLESAVVIYLRKIYFPYGFTFPLVPMESTLAITELLREFATLFMIAAVGILAGKTFKQRVAYFLFIFAVWDIFYYLFLYLIIGWPSSLLTWDILFLVPVAWAGPVVAPVMVSITMIAIGLSIIVRDELNRPLQFKRFIWILFVTGSVILIISFIWDYSSYLLENYSLKEIWSSSGGNLINLAYQYIPGNFNWLLFTLGELVIIVGIVILWTQKRSTNK